MSLNKTSTTAKVFISHSHGDREFATEIQRVLRKFGAETYLDQDKIQVADVLPDRIRQGIEWCNAFLLLWSSRAAASQWVRQEWNTAYALQKKIIPYCLDSTSLSPALENLVYVDRKDAQVSHAGLLRAVFGRSFTPSPTELFPGRWRVVLNAFGLGTATYDLDLRANAQITGTGKLDQGGMLGQLMSAEGMSDLLNVQSGVSGTWEYEEHTQILTLNMVSHGLGQNFSETIQIRTTGRDVGEIRGQDLAGRSYAIRRLPSSELNDALLELQKTLTTLRDARFTPETFQQEIEIVLACSKAFCDQRSSIVCLGDSALLEQFESICHNLEPFKKYEELDTKYEAKLVFAKLFADALLNTKIEKFRKMCFS